MKTGFYTEPSASDQLDFGCLTQGFSDSFRGARFQEIEAESFAGTYEDALRFAASAGRRAKGAIVLLDGAGGEDAFVSQLSAALECPLIGGVAARTFGKTGDGLRPGGADTALCILTDEGITCSAQMKNLHTNILDEVTLELEGKRFVRKINGEDAASFLEKCREKLGFAPDDFERVTLSTKDHVNAHMSMRDGMVYSGRDMETHMLLRSIVPGEFQPAVEAFYQEEKDALICGCAGLKKLIEREFVSACTGAFLYGEVCALDGRSEFANLMLSRLTIRPAAG